MKHLFIVNRISGKGAAFKLIPTIEKICKEKNLDYAIEVTDYPSHIKDMMKNHYDDSDTIVYSVGGDGTFLDVVNYVNPQMIVGLIPAGSGNDFYRHYYGVNKDPEGMIRRLIDKEAITVDIASTDDLKFANTTSLGIDAKISLDSSNLIRNTFITKSPAYILSIIYNVIFLKSLNVKMTVDGKDYSGEYYVINVMNGSYYGNGVKANPNAVLNDGFLELVLFKKANRLKVYKTLVKYLSGTASEEDGVYRIKCKEVNIEGKEKMACQSDGENYLTNHLNIKVLNNYLKLKISD
ncbi:MAG: YegS/Rv2252/BmrU family lipid kinase [Erysipelotrichaceae bacterium]|nr:YegS/Rv2252/BmrU family lipid kinase [Erysipelotrichaceae bacterium]